MITIEEKDALQAEVRSLKQQLKRQEALFNSVVQYSGARITVVSLEGRVLYANQLEQREAIGTSIFKSLKKEHKSQIRETMTTVLQTRKAALFESEEEIASGERRYYYHLMSPVFEDDEIAAFSIHSTDITREKETQWALELGKQELALKNQELTQFASVASHDLYEPLRTIQSFVDILKETHEGSLGEETDLYLKFISDASSRMKQLIMALLDYSRLGRTAEKELVDMNKVIQDVKDDMNVCIEESGTAIFVDELPSVSGFPTELRQLIQNLLSNAIKFRKPGNSQLVHISAKKGRKFWKFCIEDTGIGIEKEYRQQIFEIFQRLHTRQEYEGTGIGLANCQKIVQLHGGNIWVESTPDVGSTFYFTLPIKHSYSSC